MEALGLVHEDGFVSMLGKGHTQSSSLFGERDNLPVDSVATLALIGVPLEEVTAHFIYVVANFLREKRGLHGRKQDKCDRSFDKVGFASHQKIPSFPSFYFLTNIIHQILIGASCSTGGKNGCSKIGSYMVRGREAKDTCHLIFYPSRSSGREPSFRFGGTHKLS